LGDVYVLSPTSSGFDSSYVPDGTGTPDYFGPWTASKISGPQMMSHQEWPESTTFSGIDPEHEYVKPYTRHHTVPTVSGTGQYVILNPGHSSMY